MRLDHRLVRSAGCIVAAFAIAGPASAQTCSGGPDGGMDATGNQCNAWVAAALPTSTEDVPGATLMPTSGRADDDGAIRRASLQIEASSAGAAPSDAAGSSHATSSGRARRAFGR
jgi:hypothetical protein